MEEKTQGRNTFGTLRLLRNLLNTPAQFGGGGKSKRRSEKTKRRKIYKGRRLGRL